MSITFLLALSRLEFYFLCCHLCVYFLRKGRRQRLRGTERRQRCLGWVEGAEAHVSGSDAQAVGGMRLQVGYWAEEPAACGSGQGTLKSCKASGCIWLVPCFR